MAKTYAGKQKRRNYARKTNMRKPTFKSTVKQIVKKQLNKVIETKIADYSFAPSGPITGLYHNVWYRFEGDPFTMYQGTSDSETLNPINRIGDSIFVKGINFTISLESFNTYSTVQWRFVVLRIKAGSTMPLNITAHPQAVNNLIAPIDREQAALSQVIIDKHGWLVNHGQTSGGGGDGERQLLKFNVKINKKIKYEDGSAGSASYVYAPYIMLFGRQNDLGTSLGTFQYFRRTYFQDA